MVKKIPFDLIKEGQYLKLDIGKMMTVEQMLKIGKMMTVEQMLKMPTLQVLQELRALSITVMTALLSVSVHEEDGSFRGRSQKFYADKIQELLYKGHSIEEISLPITKAVVATGIAGTAAYLATFPEEATEKLANEAEKEEKNG